MKKRKRGPKKGSMMTMGEWDRMRNAKRLDAELDAFFGSSEKMTRQERHKLYVKGAV